MKKFIGISLLFFSSIAFSQPPPCPTSVPDFYGVPWDSSDCYSTVIDSCNVTICYCCRVIDLGSGNYFYDYVMTALQIADCATNSYQVFIDAERTLIYDNPKHYPCVPMPAIYYRFTRAQCWKWQYVHIGMIQYTTFTPCDEDAWCQKVYSVRCNPGKTLTPGSTVVTNSTSCDLFTGSWPVNTCKALNCN